MASILYQQRWWRYLVYTLILPVSETQTSYLFFLLEKNIFIERTIQYIKYRTENFDDYFPCIRRKKKCKLKHVRKWSNLFAYYYNRGISA